MNRGAKMMLISDKMERGENRGGSRGESRNESRNESRMGYGESNRSGGNRSGYERGGYDRGEYNRGERNEYDRGEQNGYDRMERNESGMNYDAEENRYRAENRRYSRDRRGRFKPRNEYGGIDESEEEEDTYQRPMNRIGFAMEPIQGHMEHQPMLTGYEGGKHPKKLTKEMADMWMSELQNSDGTRGPHWTMEQVKQVMAQKGIAADPISFYVALNSMYADYCKTFKKYGVGDKMDFYIDMAKDFLNDKDSVGGDEKVSAYYQHIVKH